MTRTYSLFISEESKNVLNNLLSGKGPEAYRKSMHDAGHLLANELLKLQSFAGMDSCTVVSTAEDTDYLTSGVTEVVRTRIPDGTSSVVFWNNHRRLSNGVSIAPVVHRFVQPGYESSKCLVVTKSVISGACVVRTNILALIESMQCLEKIYVLSPVMYVGAEKVLLDSFPDDIAKKFEFVFFALDSDRNSVTGEVTPGIGGQVYELLGLNGQPVSTNYIPAFVSNLVFASSLAPA